MNSNNSNKTNGCGWEKTSPKGNKYYQAQITLDKDYKCGDKLFINIFKNKYKKSEKSPDLNITINEYKKNTDNNKSGNEAKDEGILF